MQNRSHNSVCLASTLAPLQHVQNVAARLILQLDHRTPVKPALQRLHWLPVKARIEFKIATLMHAIHHQRGPAYLSNMMQFSTAESGRRQLRSSTTNAAFVVRTRTQFGKRAFSVCGPRIWYQIPTHQKPSFCSGFSQSSQDSFVSAIIDIVMHCRSIVIDVDRAL